MIRPRPGFEPGLNALAHRLGGMAEAADFFLRTPTLKASKFAALWSTDPKFWALKDLNLFLKRVKFQRTGSILKVVFVLSKWPHFHRVYLVTVCKRSLMTVHQKKAMNIGKWKQFWNWKNFCHGRLQTSFSKSTAFSVKGACPPSGWCHVQFLSWIKELFIGAFN